MSTPLIPLPAKLIVGVFMKEKSLLATVMEQLTPQLGELEMASLWLPFDNTVYYESEMGRPLFRRFLVFRELIGQADLSRIKQMTNAIEQQTALNGKRRVNIDPGYLLQERFVLATGKNFTHRIYIGRGIYADLTLIYQKGAFQLLPWTYPDYTTPAALQFLGAVRHRYREDLMRLSLLERKIYNDDGEGLA